ncbi:hypothetical protein SmJEL517_g03333 [Synchytrium microbalum]|uniref:Restriction endonuclease type IV Mrr domain-containing protein n=1 Tax=Synchytrium microbalum TaxID=1806994 RepID=A0A507C748_9FUNG|nr:uncharacterized protein SmJEL517_g03333 [Synchytrium microbalum]TPX33884.1 hypothetical protein SmJEL517_g03333 [Synchytrium microbalum]
MIRAASILRRQALNAIVEAPSRPLTNLEKGLELELATIQVFSQLGFHLRHVGGANDKGVDLRGTWNIQPPPSQPPHVNVIIQCKNEASSIGPKSIREFEGTLSKETGLTLGLFVSSRGLTKKSMQAIHASTLPIGFATLILNNSSSQTLLKELQFNHAAQRKVMPSNIVLAPRYIQASDGSWTRQVVIVAV